MLKHISIDAFGMTPAPKGSYRPVSNKNTGKTLLLPMSKNEHPWRAFIKERVQEQNTTGIHFDKQEPIYCHLAFFMPKPKTVKRELPSVKPDLDKLVRAVFDALTDSGIIEDDSQIVDLFTGKRYVCTDDKCSCGYTEQGVRIILENIEDTL